MYIIHTLVTGHSAPSEWVKCAEHGGGDTVLSFFGNTESCLVWVSHKWSWGDNRIITPTIPISNGSQTAPAAFAPTDSV